MRTAPWILALGLILIPAFAQHETAPPGQPAHGEPAPAHGEAKGHEESKGGAHHGGMEGWKWANFLLLAGGIGYLIGKNAGPFFAARSGQIRKDMAEAEEARSRSEARAAEIDRKLARLESEIDAMRREAAAQQAAEAQRIERQIAAESEKIEQHAGQEIEAAEKAARMELKRYSAQLALELAEQKVRTGMTRETQDGLLRGFVSDLERPAS
jgi:F-type H+-transporting ATPase subunit b